MKGSYTKHEGKWKKILDVRDTGVPAHKEGGGNHYILEGVNGPVHQSKVSGIKLPKEMNKADKIPGGLADNKKPADFDKKSLAAGIKVEMEHTSDRKIATEIAMDHLTEDPDYYKKLKTIEKQDRLEVTADGKIELDVGKEPLDKLKKKWASLKKALNSDIAIMTIAGQEYNPDEEEKDEKSDPKYDQENDVHDDMEEDEAESDAAEDDQSAVDTTEPMKMSTTSDEHAAAAPKAEAEVADAQEAGMSEEDIIKMLSDEGYSEAEIAHIVHGHTIPAPTLEDHKVLNERAEGDLDRKHKEDEHSSAREHKKRMNELEYEKAKGEISDPETEKNHRRRMLDLEYETTQGKKHQANLDVEHKKRMLDLEFNRAQKESEKVDPTEDLERQQMEFELAMKRMEKELELEFKKKELELKLKLTEEAARQKAEHAKYQAEADAEVNAQVKEHQAKHKIAEAKKPPKKEPKNGK